MRNESSPPNARGGAGGGVGGGGAGGAEFQAFKFAELENFQLQQRFFVN